MCACVTCWEALTCSWKSFIKFLDPMEEFGGVRCKYIFLRGEIELYLTSLLYLIIRFQVVRQMWIWLCLLKLAKLLHDVLMSFHVMSCKYLPAKRGIQIQAWTYFWILLLISMHMQTQRTIYLFIPILRFSLPPQHLQRVELYTSTAPLWACSACDSSRAPHRAQEPGSVRPEKRSVEEINTLRGYRRLSTVNLFKEHVMKML